MNTPDADRPADAANPSGEVETPDGGGEDSTTAVPPASASVDTAPVTNQGTAHDKPGSAAARKWQVIIRASSTILKTPPWWFRDIVIAVLLGLLIFGLQSLADDRREASATRLENLRFVRERSTPDDPRLGRPFAAMDLEGQNLVGLFIANSDFAFARLSRADLSFTELTGTWLAGADLTDAKLIDARLTDANLSDADLTDADLGGAKLGGANLTGANLTGTNLAGVDISVICRFTRPPKLPQGVKLPDPSRLKPCRFP